MNERERFHAQVKQVFRPVLLADGFRVAGTTYRRVLGEVIHVITIQGSVYGGRCCVCLGIHLAFLPTVGTGEACDPAKLPEPGCEFRTRLASTDRSDHWWSYGTSEAEARLSVEFMLQLYRERGAPYLGRFSTFPEDFVHLTPALLLGGGPVPFPAGGTFVQRALAASRIFLRAGRVEEAKQFAEIGLARIGFAVGLKREFEQILSTPNTERV